MAHEHRGLRLEVRRALLPVDRGHRPADQPAVMVPPSGHVAGVWAAPTSTRGVHKAPANEVVMGANGLGFQVTQAEQGELNKIGINCIRAFPGRGIRVWGARTLSSDPEWRYINVRRLVNYVSESIMEGTQWAVFEPNDERLWMQLRIVGVELPHARLARRGAVRRLARAGVLRQVRRRDQPARGDRGRPGRLRGRHRAGQAGGVRRSSASASSRRRRRPRAPSRSRRTTERSTTDDQENLTGSYYFQLNLGGARVRRATFKEVHGRRVEQRRRRAHVATSDAQGQSLIQKFAGQREWANITLKRGIDTRPRALEVASATSSTTRAWTSLARTARSSVLDSADTPVATFEFTKLAVRYTGRGA